MESDTTPIEELIDDIENESNDDDKPTVIRKHRRRFTEEARERLRIRNKSKENIEQLKKMREIRSEKKKANDILKAKAHLMKNGFDITEKKNTEPIVEKPIEQPKPEPVAEKVVEQPKPVVEKVVEQPKPAPVIEKKETKKKKKKRIVEYIDDDVQEYEQPPRPPTRQQQITQRDVDEFIRNKYATMNLKELEQRMAKQAYDFKYQKYKEEIMANQIFGRY